MKQGELRKHYDIITNTLTYGTTYVEEMTEKEVRDMVALHLPKAMIKLLKDNDIRLTLSEANLEVWSVIESPYDLPLVERAIAHIKNVNAYTIRAINEIGEGK